MINQPTIEQLIDEITLQKQTKMRIDSLSRGQHRIRTIMYAKEFCRVLYHYKLA